MSSGAGCVEAGAIAPERRVGKEDGRIRPNCRNKHALPGERGIMAPAMRWVVPCAGPQSTRSTCSKSGDTARRELPGHGPTLFLFPAHLRVRKEDWSGGASGRLFTGGDDVDESLIGLLADQLDNLLAGRLPDRSVLAERQRIVSAPPREFQSTLAPIAALPLAKNEGGVTVVVGVLVEPDRHLPTHIGLPVEWPLTTPNGRLVQRTSGPVLEAGPVEKNTGIVNGVGHPFAVIVFVDWSAHFVSVLGELPLAWLQACDLGPN